MPAPLLRSFRPLADARSRILILGSMPGPEALRKRQYYGFEGNHFWHIVPLLLGAPRPARYPDRVRLLGKHRIALWDVLHSCTRQGALDSDIRDARPNDIPGLLRRFPAIRAIFINGGFAHARFLREFGDAIDRPVFRLPSTSPANAAMPLKTKIRRWRRILGFLA